MNVKNDCLLRLVCSDCTTFLATQNDDDVARQETAE